MSVKMPDNFKKLPGVDHKPRAKIEDVGKNQFHQSKWLDFHSKGKAKLSIESDRFYSGERMLHQLFYMIPILRAVRFLH